MTKVRFTYAPDHGFRGLYDYGNGQSVCTHIHSTTNAAETCAKKTRARFNRGELHK